MATAEQHAAWQTAKEQHRVAEAAEKAAFEQICADIPPGGIRVLEGAEVPAVTRGTDGTLHEVMLRPLVES